MAKGNMTAPKALLLRNPGYCITVDLYSSGFAAERNRDLGYEYRTSDYPA